MTLGEPDFAPTHRTEYVQLVGAVCCTVAVASKPVVMKRPALGMT